VNGKLYNGYATTAAAREGRVNILHMLLEYGTSQDACEDALVEASSLGETEIVQLISSAIVGPTALSHATVIASSRGFVDEIIAFLKVCPAVFIMSKSLFEFVPGVVVI
jgi:hypothetical protein